MAKVKLVIADRDDFYTDRISRYILEKNNYFDAICFTEESYLNDYIENNNFDVLLIEEKMLTEEIKSHKDEFLIILLGTQGQKDDEFTTVSKFQKADKLLNEVMFKYAENIGDKAIISKNSGDAAKIISVFSPLGGSGKTTISVALSATLSSMGYKVLYLNLEKFNSSGYYFNFEGAAGLSEIFFKLKEKNPNISFEFMNIRLTDPNSGVLYLAPPDSAMEFLELSKEEYSTFFKEISNIGDIDYIIVDLNTDINENFFEILEASQKIVFPVAETETGLEKIKMFLKETEIFPEWKMLYEKFLPIVNFSVSENLSQQLKYYIDVQGIFGVIPNLNTIKGCNSARDLGIRLNRYLQIILNMIVR